MCKTLEQLLMSNVRIHLLAIHTRLQQLTVNLCIVYINNGQFVFISTCVQFVRNIRSCLLLLFEL